MILRAKDKRRLQAIAERTLPPEVEIWAYGSRVDGSAHDGSDLDLVLRTPDASPVDAECLLDFTEEVRASNIPILVQTFDWARLPESFHANILRNYEVLVQARASA